MLDHFQKLEGGCYTVLMTYKDVDETFFSIEGHKTIDTVNDDPINKTWIIFCRFLSVISYMYSEHCWAEMLISDTKSSLDTKHKNWNKNLLLNNLRS